MQESLKVVECIIKNGELVTKRDLKDNRKVLYFVRINNDGYTWMRRKFLIECINHPKIDVKNVRLQGNCIRVSISESYKVVKISNENINIVKKFIDKYLKENCSADEYYDYGYSNCDYFNRMKNENFSSFLKNGFIGLHNDKIETIFMVRKSSLNVLLVDTVFGEDSEELNEYVERLSDILKNSVFYYEYFPNSLSKNSKLKIMTHNSSFDNDRAYMFYHGVYLTQYGIDLFPKMVEKKYFPEIESLEEVEIKCVKAGELDTYFKNMHDNDYQGYWKSIYNNVAVAGFTYFHTEDFHSIYGDIKYLIALYKKRIIGIIKFGTWPNSNHQSLSYIDISVRYRRQGIATKMIKELNNYISSDTTFVLTDESEMGKLCSMNNICKKYITKTKVKTYDDCLRDGSYN